MEAHHPNPKEVRWLLTEKHAGKETPAFYKDLTRLEQGEPVAYVIGHVPFLGATIGLASRPLIPRPETEFWVENVIKKTRREHQGGELKCLDIFAGSGCIGIAMLTHLPFTQVTFAEKDPSHVKQINKNIEHNGILKERASVYESDIFSNIPVAQFDLILANPPYVSEDRRHTVQDSVIAWEPEEAVFAPENGLGLIARLIDGAKQYLAPHGALYIEFDPPQKTHIEELAKTHGYTVFFEKDQYGRDRVAILDR